MASGASSTPRTMLEMTVYTGNQGLVTKTSGSGMIHKVNDSRNKIKNATPATNGIAAITRKASVQAITAVPTIAGFDCGMIAVLDSLCDRYCNRNSPGVA